MAPSAFVTNPESTAATFPLVLTSCQACELLQLSHTIDRDVAFRNYWYKSALNKTMVAALRDVYECAASRIGLSTGDAWVDIGCNDGTLLSFAPDGVIRIGVEPARNLASDCRKHVDILHEDYFSAGLLGETKARLITSIAMFYAVGDPHAFVRDIAAILADDGIWIVQMMDVEGMLVSTAFDNICFEHVIYYRIADLCRLVEKYGLEVFDSSRNSTNGGSLRLYIGRKGYRYASVASRDTPCTSAITDFARAACDAANNVKEFVTAEVRHGRRIYVLGASTKGNTWLQFCHIGYPTILKAAEVHSGKWGLYTVSTNIPIAPEQECFDENPDYFLVLPWHFANDFIKRHESYLNRGGRFIVPLPRPAIVSKDEWTYL